MSLALFNLDICAGAARKPTKYNCSGPDYVWEVCGNIPKDPDFDGNAYATVENGKWVSQPTFDQIKQSTGIYEEGHMIILRNLTNYASLHSHLVRRMSPKSDWRHSSGAIIWLHLR